MADFNITINSNSFNITSTVIETECASIYEFNIIAVNSDLIDITLSGDHENEYYILNGVTNSFNDTVTGIVFNNSLTVHFIIQNSGNPGIFGESIITVDNTTQTLQREETVVRLNDDAACSPSPSSPDYDSLTDTPNNKTGSALKFIRVNAGETDHEYVTIIEDKNYIHDQPIASATWNITHNLNKFPAVTIVDTSGNEVEGEVNHTDNNNIIITFSAAFSGKAYLN